MKLIKCDGFAFNSNLTQHYLNELLMFAERMLWNSWSHYLRSGSQKSAKS